MLVLAEPAQLHIARILLRTLRTCGTGGPNDLMGLAPLLGRTFPLTPMFASDRPWACFFPLVIKDSVVNYPT